MAAFHAWNIEHGGGGNSNGEFFTFVSCHWEQLAGRLCFHAGWNHWKTGIRWLLPSQRKTFIDSFVSDASVRA